MRLCFSTWTCTKAAQPQTELTTTKVVPCLLIADSTSSVVCKDVNPAEVKSSHWLNDFLWIHINVCFQILNKISQKNHANTCELENYLENMTEGQFLMPIQLGTEIDNSYKNRIYEFCKWIGAGIGWTFGGPIEL